MNPYKITDYDVPYWVFSDLSSGLAQFLIKWWTNSLFHHAMMILWPGKFTSQGNIFSNTPMDRYLKKNSRLEFWRIIDLTIEERKKLYKMVMDDLALPKRKRRYDYLGVLIGQFSKIKKINHPNKYFCSERNAKYIRAIGITDCPEHPSPEDLREFFKGSDRFERVGEWTAE